MSEIPWFKVDDNLTFHAKVVAAGNPAMGLWVRAGSWCALQLTDGFIPDHMLAALGTKAQAEKLVEVRLWDRAQGGYEFHGWAERQPQKADVEAERAAARNRMREVRAKRKGTAPKESAQVGDPGSPELRENFGRSSEEVPAQFALPDPVPVPVTNPVPEKRGRRKAARAIPDDWQPNEKHAATAAQERVDLSGEAFRFRNNAVAKDLRYADWDAAFRNWLTSGYAKKVSPRAHRTDLPEAWQ